MKRALCLLLGLALVSVTAWAQDKKGDDKKADELTDPVKILKKVDAACKAVKAVKYEVTYAAKGMPDIPPARHEASIIATGCVEREPEKYVIDVKSTAPGSKESRRITGGSDGDVYYVIDHQAKKAYVDVDPQVSGSFRSLLTQGVMMIEFLYATPFDDEIKGKKQELKGSKKINGVDCYEVYVVYADNPYQATATWYFSKKDFLPRGRIDEFTTPDGQKVSQKKMLSKLVVDPKLDKDAFKLKLPEGYTKTDDFAP